MTDTAESASPSGLSLPRRLVFTTAEADALALEAVLKPTDRGWRSLLGYAFALPPLVGISWLTRNAEWPVWFASFGLVGLAAWQSAHLVLRTERRRAARRHPTGAGQITSIDGRLEGTVGGVMIDISAADTARLETDSHRLYILADGRPALIVPLSAFSGRADMTAFVASMKKAD